ncbi:Anaphase-promoting complex subunit 4, partial [Dissostichus eleginoides]
RSMWSENKEERSPSAAVQTFFELTPMENIPLQCVYKTSIRVFNDLHMCVMLPLRRDERTTAG